MVEQNQIKKEDFSPLLTAKEEGKKVDAKQNGQQQQDAGNNASQAMESIGKATIDCKALNVRSGPGIENSRLGVLEQGAQVEVLSEKDGWLQISYKGQLGYVSSSYTKYVLKGGKTNAKQNTVPIGNAEVSCKALNVRSGAGVENGKIGELSEGDQVKVYGKKDGWYEIRIGDKVGYISGKYVEFSTGEIDARQKSEEKKSKVVEKEKSEEERKQVAEKKKEEGDKKEEKKEEGDKEAGSVIDKATVTAGALNVRSGAGVDKAKIGLVYSGTKLEVLGKENDWLKVKFEDGIGFVSAHYTVLDSQLPKPLDLSQLDFNKAPTGLKDLLEKDTLSTEEISKARELIKGMDKEKQGDFYEVLQTKTPYRSQRNNASDNGKIGDVMCNLTSLAMCMESLGIPNPYPNMQYEDALEKMRRENGLGDRTTISGWGGVANLMGANYQLLAEPYGSKAIPKEFWLTTVRTALREGKSIMTSVCGHIVRVQNVTEQGVVVDDPYGAMLLMAGKGYKFVQENNKTTEGGNPGDNSFWDFKDLNTHYMNWICAFYK